MKVRRIAPEPFIGLESRPVSPETLERAHRSTQRFRRGQRLAKKLDQLLGPVDGDDSDAEGES